MHRWLSAIVLLLFLPLMLFAGLWLRQSLGALETLDRNLATLAALEHLKPALRRALLADLTTEPPLQLDTTGHLHLRSEHQTRAVELYFELLNPGNLKEALESGSELIRLLTSHIEMPPAAPPRAQTLDLLIRHTLLEVLLEANAVRERTLAIANHPLLNISDKLAITVSGGQYKLVADAVDRFTAELLQDEDWAADPQLRDLATLYMLANRTFQTSGRRLLVSAIEEERGADLYLAPVLRDFPQLIAATLDLWVGAIQTSNQELSRLRQESLRSVGLASLSGGLVIVFTLALAVLYSRQLMEQAGETLIHLESLDSLTGLGNRQSLTYTAPAPNEAEDVWSGLLHLDLRRFRAINTRYGEDIGDQVLKAVASLLKSMIPETAQVARAGGAEFIVLISRLHKQRDLEDLADRITVALAAERFVHGHAIPLDCCIGLSLLKAGSGDLERLLTDASLALRAAKSKGSFGTCLYAPHMRQSFVRNSEIAKDLQEAMSRGQIVPWYQPQICTRTGRIVGVEALVRWIDENGAPRSPASFLPAAEEAGYMNRLDTVIRARALSEIARIPICREGSFHIGLNITAGILAEPDCVTQLLDATSQAGLSPSQVSIEILEAVMLDRPDATPILKNVTHLSRLGFHMELDDFGTGHASIASLRDLKIDRVKIDRSFVAGVHANQELQTFTRALIQLARSLGIEVLAEGVEMEEERRWLTANGCAVLQGYLFARAMPFDDLRALMERQPFLLEIVPPPGRQTTAQAC